MQTESNRTQTAIFALTFSAFAIVTTETIIIGVLPLLANDLSVSITTAGLLVTAFAFTAALCAPVLTLITAKFNRRRLLMGTLALLVIANVLSAIAPNYGVLVIARIAAAVSLAIFWSIVAVVASSLVPENRQGWAISMVFSGISIATVLGVPLGTFVAQSLGWRAAFGILSGLSLLALLLLARFLPQVPIVAPPNLRTQLGLLRKPSLLLAMAVSMIVMTGHFLAFTYLVPFLEQVTRFQGSSTSAILLLFGGASLIGNFVGGRASDGGVVRALLVTMSVLAVALLALFALGASQGGVVALVLIWGAAQAALFLEIQYRMIELAPEAPNASSSFNVTIINAGIGSGAFFGGLVVEAATVRDIGWIGGVVVLGALGLMWLSVSGIWSTSK